MGFRSSILAGITLIRQAIQSPDYVAGVSGWSIKRDGSAEFNNATMRGQVHVGGASDYVKVTPTPVPLITFGTSAGSVDTPATIGYALVGSQLFRIVGPGQGGLNGALSFTSTTTTLTAGDNMVVSAPASVVVNSPAVQIGGNSSPFAISDANGGTYTFKGVDQGRGLVEYQATQSDSATTTTTEIATITTDTVTFKAGRAYRVEYHALVVSTVAGDIVRMRLWRGEISGAGVSLVDSQTTNIINITNQPVLADLPQFVRNSTGSDVTAALIGTVFRNNGTGTVKLLATAANPAWILIEDVGVATDYPNARSI